MRWSLFMAVLAWAPGGAAEMSYRNSRGECITLTPIEGRRLVRPPAARPPAAAIEGLRWAGGRIEVDARAVPALKAAGLVEDAGQIFAVPGTALTFGLDCDLLVRLQDGARPEHIAVELGKLGLAKAAPLSDRVLKLQARTTEGALEAATVLADLAAVAWALPDFLLPIELHSISDPYFSAQWTLAQPNGADVHAEGAWALSWGDPAVRVAVIDTGVEEGHPDFDPRLVLKGYDATGTGDPRPGPTSRDAHGTACAALIAAQVDNREGMAGLCPACTLMPVKMLDGATSQMSLSQGYLALRYALDADAWVISNSWGISEAVTQIIDLEPFREVIREAVSRGRGGLGTIVLFASGNGLAGEAQPIGEHELANMSEVMAVGATGPDDQVLAYSDFGPNLSVVAPSGTFDPTIVGVLTADTLGERGASRHGSWFQNVLFTDMDMHASEPDLAGNYTAHFNGTSAACPLAAAAMALVLSVDPGLRGEEARRIVEETADRVGDLPYDSAGQNSRYGHGRINAARAVRAAALGQVQPDGAPCILDRNCENATCLRLTEEGVCAAACASDAACPAPLGCRRGHCLRPCTTTSENRRGARQFSDVIWAAGLHPRWESGCRAFEVCDAGFCAQVVCADASDCPAGSACPLSGAPRLCAPACAADRECLAPALCLDALGGSLCQTATCDAGCPTGTRCPRAGGICERTCSSHADCPTTAVCADEGHGALCQVLLCSAHVDCPASSMCADDGRCTPLSIYSAGSAGCGAGTCSGIWFALVCVLAGLRGQRIQRRPPSADTPSSDNRLPAR